VSLNCSPSASIDKQIPKRYAKEAQASRDHNKSFSCHHSSVAINYFSNEPQPRTEQPSGAALRDDIERVENARAHSELMKISCAVILSQFAFCGLAIWVARSFGLAIICIFFLSHFSEKLFWWTVLFLTLSSLTQRAKT
jgi:hypothetical protein